MGDAELPGFPFERPGTLQSPVEFARLRETEPMSWVRTRVGDTSWLATRYDDIRFVLADGRFSPHLHGGAMGWVAGAQTENSLFQDPPGHTRLRRLVTGAFTARRAEGMRDRVREITRSLLDRMREMERPADLTAALSYPLPIAVIGELLGIPKDDQETFRSWSDTFLTVSEDTLAQAAEAWSELNAYIPRLIAAKRADPGTDLLSSLIAVRDENDDRLSEDELIMMTISLLVGGYATTANAISIGVIYLLEHDRLAELKGDQALLESAVEETLRHNPGGGEMRRVAREDVQVGGVTVKAGETVLIPLEAANRDPARFTDPGGFDITRSPNPHLTFGHGIHRCLGSPLARVELSVAFEELASAFPTLRLAVPVPEIPWSVRLLDEGPGEVLVTW